MPEIRDEKRKDDEWELICLLDSNGRRNKAGRARIRKTEERLRKAYERRGTPILPWPNSYEVGLDVGIGIADSFGGVESKDRISSLADTIRKGAEAAYGENIVGGNGFDVAESFRLAALAFAAGLEKGLSLSE